MPEMDQVVQVLMEIRDELKYHGKMLEFMYSTVEAWDCQSKKASMAGMDEERLSMLKEMTEAFQRGNLSGKEFSSKMMGIASSTLERLHTMSAGMASKAEARQRAAIKKD